MANAVPVVLPDHGSFPEMIADTGGGILHYPHDSSDLADKLAQMLNNSENAAKLGLSGQRSVREVYHATAMAQKTLDLYHHLNRR
jgi:glycosyltransferase involved in cell wall biosynthesis